MVCARWAAVLGSRPPVDADHRKTTNPLTGKPDAGDPPVRFGGRGKVPSLVPTSIGAVFLPQTGQAAQSPRETLNKSFNHEWTRMNTNEIKASNRLIRVGSCPFVVKSSLPQPQSKIQGTTGIEIGNPMFCRPFETRGRGAMPVPTLKRRGILKCPSWTRTHRGACNGR